MPRAGRGSAAPLQCALQHSNLLATKAWTGDLAAGPQVQSSRVLFLDMASDGLEEAAALDHPSLERDGAMARFRDWGKKYRMRRRKALILNFFLGFHIRSR